MSAQSVPKPTIMGKLGRGLIVTAQAIVGYAVSPRELGKYQGISLAECFLRHDFGDFLLSAKARMHATAHPP
jgi:hypothetical protein